MKDNSLRQILITGLFVLFLFGCSPGPDQRMAMARDYMQENNYRAAMIELKNLLLENPDNAKARMLLAEVSLTLGDFRGAESEMIRAIELGAEKEVYQDLHFRTQLALGRNETVLAEVAPDRPAHGISTERRKEIRAQALLGMNQWEEAKISFEEVLKDNADSLVGRVGLARALLGLGFKEDASRILTLLTDSNKLYVPGWQALGESLLQQENPVAAQEAFAMTARLAKAEPDVYQKAQALTSLADVQLTNGNFDQARESISELSSIAPASFITRFLIARLDFSSGELQKATTELHRLLNDYPKDLRIELLLGAVQAARGNLGQAETSIQKVISLSPDSVLPRKLMAKIQLQRGRPEQVIQVLAPILSSDLQDSELFALAGAAKMRVGEHESAANYLRQALAIDPTNSNLRIELAAALIAGGDALDGISVLEAVPDRKEVNYRKEFLLLLAHSRNDDQDGVNAEIARFLAEHGSDATALNLVGAFFVSRKEFDQGRLYLQKALGISPDNISSLVNLIRLEFLVGRDEEAEKYLNHLRTLGEGNLIALQWLAELAYKQGEVTRAGNLFDEARERYPEAVEVRLAAGRMFLKERALSRAESVVNELLPLTPDLVAVQELSGDVMLALGRSDEALVHYRRWAMASPMDPAASFAVARVHLKNSDCNSAKQSLKETLKLGPGWLPPSLILAELELREGNLAESKRIASDIRKSHPDSPASAVLDGDMAMSSGDYAVALRAYQNAYRALPNTQIVIRVYEASKMAGGKNPHQILEDWLGEHPDDYLVAFTLAAYYQLLGEITAAIGSYERILKYRPDDVASLNNLAWLLNEAGDVRAEKVARRAYALRPELSPVMDTLGWILIGQGELQEGVELLRAAVKQSPDASEVRYHLGVALQKTGSLAEAKENLSRALASDTDGPWRSEAEKLLAGL